MGNLAPVLSVTAADRRATSALRSSVHKRKRAKVREKPWPDPTAWGLGGVHAAGKMMFQLFRPRPPSAFKKDNTASAVHTFKTQARAPHDHGETDMTQVIEKIGAGEGNRTLVISLEGCCSTIELHPRSLPVGFSPRPWLHSGSTRGCNRARETIVPLPSGRVAVRSGMDGESFCRVMASVLNYKSTSDKVR